MQRHLYHICAQAVNPGGGYTVTDAFVTRSEKFTGAESQKQFRDWFSETHMQGRSTVFTSITYLGPVEVSDEEEVLVP